jgi:hypothetical protein
VIGFSPARSSQERPCEQTFPTTELENRLARQKMDCMAEGLGVPQQSIRGDRIVLSPIIVAISFPDSKCGVKRGVCLHHYRFHHWIDSGSHLTASRSGAIPWVPDTVSRSKRLLMSGFERALSAGKSTTGAWVSWTLADCLGAFLYYLQLSESPRWQDVSDSAELVIYYKLYRK